VVVVGLPLEIVLAFLDHLHGLCGGLFEPGEPRLSLGQRTQELIELARGRRLAGDAGCAD
jgi:hypothetical protein